MMEIFLQSVPLYRSVDTSICISFDFACSLSLEFENGSLFYASVTIGGQSEGLMGSVSIAFDQFAGFGID